MFTRFSRVGIIFAAALLAGSVAVAVAAPPTKAEIAKAIQQLGDSSFEVREKASEFLWKAGRAAEPALQEALKSEDPEVIRRTREILAKFKWGIYPDTPKNILTLIDEYRFGDDNGKQNVIQKLLQLGNKGHMVLLKLAEAEENAELRRTVLLRISQEAAQTVRTLLTEGKFAEMEELLELSMAADDEASLRNYVAFLLLRSKIEEKLPYWKSKAEPNNRQAAAVLAYLYKAKGDLASARRLAEKAAKPHLLKAILYEQGDWDGLLAAPDARRPNDEANDIERLGYRAAYQRLAGRTGEFQKTISEIQKFGVSRPADSSPDSASWFSAEALLLNDRPQEAIALLTKSKNFLAVFELLTIQGKYREAFALADKIDQVAVQVRKARTLYVLGERDQALQVFAALGDKIEKAKDPSEYAALVDVEYKLDLKNLAFDHAARVLARGTKERAQTSVLYHIFPKDFVSALRWEKYFRDKYPDDAPASNLKRIRELFEGKVKGEELDKLVGDAQDAVPAKEGTREAWLISLGELCLRAGQETTAQSYFEKAANELGSTTALTRLGDFLAEREQWEKAAERYYAAWTQDRPRAAVPLYLSGWALSKAGNAVEAKKRIEQARLLPLGNEQERHALAQALAEHKLADAARAEYDLIIRLGSEESWYVGDALRHAAQDALAKKDCLKAAANYERAMLRCLQTNTGFLETGAYLVVPHMVHRYRARGLLAAGRLDEARKETALCLAALPGHVELPILLVPELEKRAMKKDADELFNRTFGTLEKQCADYPKSAWARNNLAWLTACCRRQLDKGLEHSREAVKLASNNAGYLDTLAEVHFQRGDRDQALQLMKKCIELDPKNRYFRDQLKRFEAGDPKAPLPESPDNE